MDASSEFRQGEFGARATRRNDSHRFASAVSLDLDCADVGVQNSSENAALVLETVDRGIR